MSASGIEPGSDTLHERPLTTGLLGTCHARVPAQLSPSAIPGRPHVFFPMSG